MSETAVPLTSFGPSTNVLLKPALPQGYSSPLATPALVGTTIVIRTEKSLYAFAAGK